MARRQQADELPAAIRELESGGLRSEAWMTGVTFDE